jgi:peroxiredoxin
MGRGIVFSALVAAVALAGFVACGHFEGRYDGAPIDTGDDDGGSGGGILGDDDSAGGTPLNNYSWTNDNGDGVQLYDYKGDVVLLNFGAGWCQPCREEAPNLESEIYETYHDRGFEIIELLVEDNSNRPPDQDFLQSWRDEYGLTYEVCADPNWTTIQDLTTDLTLPYGLFLDRDLVPRYESRGYDRAVYEELIQLLL